MKHIKRKFLFEDSLSNFVLNKSNFVSKFDLQSMKDETSSILNQSKDFKLILETTTNSKILAYIHNEQGNNCIVPLPDFTLVYYDTAYKSNIERKRIRKQIFSKIYTLEKVPETAEEFFYDFYGSSTSCIINMFTSLESFINSILKPDFKYERISSKSTEIFNYDQIQKSIEIVEKINKILPKMYNRSFFKIHEKEYNLIINLKDLRNDIVHTKSDPTADIHVKLFKQIIDFKYDDTLKSIKTFMNFYKSNYIIDCPCEKEF